MTRTLLPMMLALLSMACGPTTVGESCDLLGNTLCTKCFAETKATCMASMFRNCCTATTCERSVHDSGKVLQCSEQINATSCSSMLQGNLPTVCFGVATP